MPVRSGVCSRRMARRVCVVVSTCVILLGSQPAHGQDPVSKRPLGRSIPVYEPTSADPGRPEAPPLQNPTGDLSLGEAAALALLNNPQLASVAWETRAREARILQAARHPNPTLGVVVEDYGARQFAGGGVNEPVQPQATIQLSQLIELGGKRAARQLLARRDRDLAAWDYETARIDVLTQVSRAFTDVLAAQETVALTEETTRLVAQVQQSVGARVVAGVVSPIEETRATVASATVQIALAQARRTLTANRARLALLWGNPSPVFTKVLGNLTAEPPPLPSLDDLAIRVEQSPALARWAAEMSQREAALAVERSKQVPDVSVVGGYRRFSAVDSNAVVFGASMSLPLFDRNQGGVAEARSRLAKAHEEQRAAQADIRAALAEAYATLSSAHDEVTALAAAVLPGSQEAFAAVSEGYRLGRFGYLDVLESQRTLINAGSQYLRALSDYYKAIAGVERLIGAPLSGNIDLPTTARE